MSSKKAPLIILKEKCKVPQWLNIDRHESREFLITFNTVTETVGLVDASVKGLVRVCDCLSRKLRGL